MPSSRLLLAAALTAVACAAGARPVTYRIDPDHTYPSFEADHMGVSTWRGKLDRTRGTIVYDRATGSGTIDVELDPASIAFGLPKLDAWARGKDFLDVARHPHAHYRGHFSGAIEGHPATVQGTLSLHGHEQPVALRIRGITCIPHPLYQRTLCGTDAFGSFRRDRFGLDAGKDYGFDMTVALRIQVEALAEP